MISQQVLGGEAACGLVDTCRAVTSDVLPEQVPGIMALLNVMLDLVYKFIEPLRWMR